LLPLLERAQSSTFDCRDVDKHILAAALRLNESIAFGRIEPFDRAVRHSGSPKLTIQDINVGRPTLPTAYFGSILNPPCSRIAPERSATAGIEPLAGDVIGFVLIFPDRTRDSGDGASHVRRGAVAAGTCPFQQVT
jgi:hypothetical protein